MNCSAYKNSIIVKKKEQLELLRTSVQVSCYHSTQSSKLSYRKACNITGSDCMTLYAIAAILQQGNPPVGPPTPEHL